MPRKRALKLEVADGIREVKLGAYRKTGDVTETEWLDRNRLGTEPYAWWCGRTAGATPPPTRFTFNRVPSFKRYFQWQTTNAALIVRNGLPVKPYFLDMGSSGLYGRMNFVTPKCLRELLD